MLKRITGCTRTTLGLFALVLASPTVALAHQQTIELQPGWTSIYLEVEPTMRDIPSVFGSANCGGPVPLLSVWTYEPRFGRVGAPLNPAEGLISATGWFGHFPENTPEAVLTTLHGMRANRAYLVNLGGTLPVVCNVSGNPRLEPRTWIPDSFNLTGLRVDPANPPSFAVYFEPSPAHANQPIFRLDANGFWQQVQPYFEPVRAGSAYWVYTEGPSKYQGPLDVELEFGDGLEFGATLSRRALTVHNRLDLDVAVELALLTSASPVPLEVESVEGDEGIDIAWMPLPADFSFTVQAGDDTPLTLGPDRSGLDPGSGRGDQTLSITNGLGGRVLIHVGASLPNSASGGGGNSASSGVAGSSFGGMQHLGATGSSASARPSGATSDLTGLWVGTAVVDRVSEVRCEIAPPQNCSCVPGACRSTITLPCTANEDCPDPDDPTGPPDSALVQDCDTDEECPDPDDPGGPASPTTGICDLDSDVSPFGQCRFNFRGDCLIDLGELNGTCRVTGSLAACDDVTPCPPNEACQPTEADPRHHFECANDDPLFDEMTQTVVGSYTCPDPTVCQCDPLVCIDTDAAAEPTAAAGSFELRLLVHVDAAGNATLLKEVVQLYSEPTFGPDPENPGYDQLVTPGEIVLVTDDALIPTIYNPPGVTSYGLAMRDGKPVGIRIATAAYDFDDDSTGWVEASKGLTLGQLSSPTSGTLSAAITMGPDFPTHPFRHLYHPQHDNKNPLGQALTNACAITGATCSSAADCFDAMGVDNGPCVVGAQEVPTITRTMILQFSGTFPDIADGAQAEPPDWGSEMIGGLYTEEVEGLVRRDEMTPTKVTSKGSFLLRRLTATPTLNAN